MKDFPEQYFDTGSHKIAYRLQECPGKDNILLLHGLGASLSQFDREISGLAQSYSVAALSLRGQGSSTRPEGNKPEDMRISELASDVIQWMHIHKWKDAHIVACSMGGVVALEILRQDSSLCRSLITFGTTPKLKLPSGLIRGAAYITDIILPGLFPDWMAKTLPRTISNKTETQARFTEDLKLAFSQRASVYQLRCELANYDYLQVLKETRVPVLLLQGEKDKDINGSIKKLWPEISTNSIIQHRIIKDAGHITNYDQPEKFVEAVLQFIAGAAA